MNKRGRKKNKSEREREKERKREKRERERAWLVFDFVCSQLLRVMFGALSVFSIDFRLSFLGLTIVSSQQHVCRCRFKYVGVELSLSVTMPP